MQRVYTGIDLGTHHVKVVIAAPGERPESPMHILATASSPSKGMRQGYIVEPAEVQKSLREALHRASGAASVRIRKARVAAGGVGLDEMRITGDVSLTPSGGIVSPRDMERLLRECEKRAAPKMTNHTLLHTVPLSFLLDGTPVYGNPQGLQGTKLSAESLIVSMLTHHHDMLLEVVEGAGVEVEMVMAAPLAASLVTLSKAQRTAGVALLVMGAQTTALAVFENDALISTKVLPIGSADVTNALALALQISLIEAEQIKRGAVMKGSVPQKRIERVVETHLKELFLTIDKHLVSIKRSRLLPAGVVLTGGGSGLQTAPSMARTILKLPSSIAHIGTLERSSGMDPSFAVAYGLARGAYAEEFSAHASLGNAFGGIWDYLRHIARSMLP
jgi:cell division protein FtsA